MLEGGTAGAARYLRDAEVWQAVKCPSALPGLAVTEPLRVDAAPLADALMA